MATFFHVNGLKGMKRQLAAGLRTGGSGSPVRAMLRQWGTRYARQVRSDFDRNSKGGGDWQRLRPSTVRGRRKGGARRGGVTRVRGKRQRRSAILVDTGLLKAGLRRGQPGNLFRDVPRGIRVGFTENRHPGGKSYAQIADYHHRGAGRLPRRRIFRKPDSTTAQGMKRDARGALRRMMRENAS
ncbi:MAG: hypothetical protein AAF432_00415 [Planctomycetota bacterium]